MRMSAKQFDVFANPDPGSAKSHPYFIVLQTDQLADLNTRVVAPLIPPRSIQFFERIMPEVKIEGSTFVIDPTNLGVVRVGMLSKFVTNLESERYRILAALDLVFVGV